jgi:hypothetical protein
MVKAFILSLLLALSCNLSPPNAGVSAVQPLRIFLTAGVFGNNGGHHGSSRPFEGHGFLDPNPDPTLEELAETFTVPEIDDVLDQVIGNNGGIIIQKFRPERAWLWKQFYGTILYHSLTSAVINMTLTFLFCLVMGKLTHGDWKSAAIAPQKDHPLVMRLLVLEKVWKTMSSLTTFLLTFFVGQAYGMWRSFYDIGRSIQGRMNDISLLLATHAARNKRDGAYTQESRLFLASMASKLRAFHILMWASNARRFRVLLTDPGMSRLVTRQVLTQKEWEVLSQLRIPKTQRHVAVLESTMISIRMAMDTGIIQGGSGLELMMLDKFCALRSVYGKIAHQVAARMPMAYAHFVQILVDSFLLLAPLAQ